MKILAKPIDMIASTQKNGVITPIKFRVNENDEDKVIKIDKIIFADKEKMAGNIMYLYRCRSLIDNKDIIYEIKYELMSCKWILWKM